MTLLILREDGVDKGAGASLSLCARYVNDVETIKVRRLKQKIIRVSLLHPSIDLTNEEGVSVVTHSISDPGEIRPHLCDAKDRIRQNARLVTSLNHRKWRLKLIELVNRILSDIK
jgi:hypothetical protein